MRELITSKVAECPMCETEQELFLFGGVFIDPDRQVSDGRGGMRNAQQYKRLFICMQCAEQAVSGNFVQARQKGEPR